MIDIESANYLGEVYSNFDHKLEDDVVEKLKGTENSFAQHSAWGFCGYVYFQGDKWHEDVWRNNIFRQTIDGDSAIEVIEQAIDKYGSE